MPLYTSRDVTANWNRGTNDKLSGWFGRSRRGSTIQFSWMNSDVDNASLTCEILTPTQLVDEDAFGGGTASSEQITWVDAEDDEDGSILLLLLLL